MSKLCACIEMTPQLDVWVKSNSVWGKMISTHDHVSGIFINLADWAQPHRAQSTGPWTTWDYSCPPYSRNVQHVLLIVDGRSGACPQYLKINTKLHSLKARKTLSYFTSHVFGCKWLVFKLSACVFTSLHQLETLSKPSGLHWSEIQK